MHFGGEIYPNAFGLDQSSLALSSATLSFASWPMTVTSWQHQEKLCSARHNHCQNATVQGPKWLMQRLKTIKPCLLASERLTILPVIRPMPRQ